MRYLPLTVCALLFALPAKADKFWLSDPADEKNAAAGSSPNILEGVLIAETDDTYQVRIVGGEVFLSKKAVFKVEKDGLTVDAIAKAEKDSAEALAAANRERELQDQIKRGERQVKAAEASARRTAKATEASASRSDVAPAPVYDPVLDVVPQVPAVDPQIAAKIAFEQTGDRAYLKLLRQLRRSR